MAGAAKTRNNYNNKKNKRASKNYGPWTKQKSNFKTRFSGNKNLHKKTIGRVDNNDYKGLEGGFIKATDNNDYDGIAVDNNANESGEKKATIRPNVLHRYATYNYIFTLSGITERELNTHEYMGNPPHDIIARTGGIGDANFSGTTEVEDTGGQDPEYDATTIQRQKAFDEEYNDSIRILLRGHDIFIENVNIVSTAGPNTERGLGQFTKMEFEIHEPYGCSFIEKVRATTALNGYKDYQDAPLLLTIDFKGFDEHGKPVASQPGHVRKIPVLISRVEFDVDQSGTKYSMVATPYTELPYDDRFKFSRTLVPVFAKDIDEWVANVQAVLKQQMTDEIKEGQRQYADEYVFDITDEVREAGLTYRGQQKTNLTGSVEETLKINTPFGTTVDTEIKLGTDSVGTNDPLENGKTKVKKIEGSADMQISLVKFFEDAIRAGTGYQDLAESFWTAYLKGTGQVSDATLKDPVKVAELFTKDDGKQIQAIVDKNQYVNWFKIKTSARTDTERFDKITKMHPKKIIYQAVQVKLHVAKFLKPGISIGKIDWRSRVHKEYNYIYTGDNIDVRNLRMYYKSAYYMRNVRGDDESNTGQITFDTTKRKGAIGREDYPEELMPLRTYPSSLRGRSLLKGDEKSKKPQEFYDYLTNPVADMAKIELQILGDPAYLCQDIHMPIKALGNNTKIGGTGPYDFINENFNADNYVPLININYRIPDDIDELEGTTFTNKAKYRDENIFFNGLYQVNKIESTFNQGTFEQTLFCSRFNNQQGAGIDPEMVQFSNQSIDSILEGAEKEKRKNEKWNNIKDYKNLQIPTI